MKKNLRNDQGSIEMIVLGLLAALIVVLAIPIISSLGANTNNSLNTLNNRVTTP